MASYKLTIKKSAEKELKDIHQKDIRRIIRRIQSLGSAPRPSGSEKLSAHLYYRIRQGDYRIIYSIDDTNRIVDILKIGHRREIYRL
ncbi:MAG: type II toxin-antitoxin system RelE/ParE family toxin [Sedimentisphaerales bacterium]|nr:type II toxin-antitoxin system RelE/ParE family toxin [Sedimentisphaerales bacterium]